MKTPFLTLMAALLILAACAKKEKDTTITGQVRTFGTEEAIKHPPLEVVIYERQVSGTFMGGPSYTVVATTTTDENANYSLTAKLHTDKEYYLGVEANTVNESYHYIKPEFKDLEERKINTIGGDFTKHYFLRAIGWVRFRFVNENSNIDDLLSFNLGGGAHGIRGGFVDEVIVLDYASNMNHTIYYHVTKGGVKTSYEKSFIVSPFDTLNIKIEY